MKKHLLLAAFVCCVASVSAQNPKGTFSIKPMAGINVTGLSGGIHDIYDYKVRFTAGLEAEYGMNDWMGVSLGVIYSQQGADVDGSFRTVITDTQGKNYMALIRMDGKLHSEYINIPLLANFYIPFVKGLSVKTGVQFGFLVSSKLEATTVAATQEAPDYGTDQLSVYDGHVEYSVVNSKSTDVFKSVDMGIPVGLSYEYKNVVLDARYYFGLTKIDRTEYPEDCRNRHFSVTLGYRFHL